MQAQKAEGTRDLMGREMRDWQRMQRIAAEVFVAPYIMTTRAGFYLAALSLDAGGGRDGDPGAGRERGDGGDCREPWE